MTTLFFPWTMLDQQPDMQRIWHQVVSEVHEYLPRSQRPYQEILRQALAKGSHVPDKASVAGLQGVLVHLKQQPKIRDDELARALILLWSDCHRREINALRQGLKKHKLPIEIASITPDSIGRGFDAKLAEKLAVIDSCILSTARPVDSVSDPSILSTKLVYLCATAMATSSRDSSTDLEQLLASMRSSTISLSFEGLIRPEQQIPADGMQTAVKGTAAVLLAEMGDQSDTPSEKNDIFDGEEDKGTIVPSPRDKGDHLEVTEGSVGPEALDFTTDGDAVRTTTDIVQWSIPIARQKLEEWSAKLDRSREKLLAANTKLSNQIINGSTLSIADVLSELVDGYKRSLEKIAIIEQEFGGLGQWLKQEIAIRLDIAEITPTFKFDSESTPVLNPKRLLADAVTCIDKLETYDRQRNLQVDEWQRLETQRIDILAELTILVPDYAGRSDEPLEAAPGKNDLLETVKSARNALDDHCSQLKREAEIARQTTISRLVENAARLQDFGVAKTTEIAENVRLSDISSDQIIDWHALRLATVAYIVQQRVDELSHVPPKASTSELADILRTGWDIDVFLELLDQLTRAGRNEEVFILVNTATATSRREIFTLPESVVQSLLDGLVSLAAATDDAQLLNLLFGTTATGWQTTDTTGKIRWGIALLRAHFAGPFSIPRDHLWHSFKEWPDQYMPKWHDLWEMFLVDQPFAVQPDSSVIERQRLLTDRRKAAEQLLTQDKGSFARARVASKRHAKVLNTVLLPWCSNKLEALKTLEDSLNTLDATAGAGRSANRISESALLLITDLSEEAAYQRYDEAIASEDINDNNPHHRTTTLRIVLDCAESLRSYAETISRFAQTTIDQSNKFSLETLQHELARRFSSKMTPAGLEIGSLVNGRGPAFGPRDEEVAQAQGIAIIEYTLLTQPALIRRLPQTVAHLAVHRLSWVNLWRRMLDDLADPLTSIAEIAETLLTSCAPNQVLHFAQEVDSERLQRAQIMDDRNSRKASARHADLLELGGQYPNWQQETQAGRWPLLLTELQTELDKCREVRRIAEERHQQHLTGIFQKIQAMQARLFQSYSSMPPGSYDAAMRGLQQAQLAITSAGVSREGIFDAIDAYCEQLIYQADHDSWPVDKINRITAELAESLTQLQSDVGALDSNRVLKLLEQRDLASLGLNPSVFDASKTESRIELLHLWRTVQHFKHMAWEDLTTMERNIMLKLTQKFALVVQLAQKFGQDNRHITNIDSALYGVYKLRLPKSPSLEKDCVVLILPGNPPVPAHISLVENMIDDQEWLEERFVILLAPGCTLKLRERLERGRRDNGLVIIDDPTLTRMVIAEREQRRAVGVLRSTMVNARNAADTEVFRVEKAVEPRTGIFVGRDDLIRQVVDGNSNVALYGGRRIGKSSILSVAFSRLNERENTKVIHHSFLGGESAWNDDKVAATLAQKLALAGGTNIQTFSMALQKFLEENRELRIIILLDEVDHYIKNYPKRHVLIETLRSLSDLFGDRLRVIVAGFIELYKCLNGQGPYPGNDDPWGRMFYHTGPVPNLKADHAEDIVREGFWDLLGWRFENSMIPQQVVERTGGHPDFVQHFCLKLQERVAARGDQIIRVDDIKAVFSDDDPGYSFIAHVRKTLEMNLDPVAHLLILLIADQAKESRKLSFEQFQKVAGLCQGVEIPRQKIEESLRLLKVTSVVNESKPNIYEFTVPDYPLILSRLEETRHLDELEEKVTQTLRSS